MIEDAWSRWYLASINNVYACHNFAYRLKTRFDWVIRIPADGYPHPIPGKHNGPYISFLQRLRSTSPQIPLEIVDEWKALCQQGWKIRQALLEIEPEFSVEYLFPLNLQGGV